MSDWPCLLPESVTAADLLKDWQHRQRMVETREAAFFSSLPFVAAVATIGSLARGSSWPGSDVDLLLVALESFEPRVDEAVRHIETERNSLLRKDRMLIEVEVSNWVLLDTEVQSAVGEPEGVFLLRLRHPHWLWIALKSQGATRATPSSAPLASLLTRLQAVFTEPRFRLGWMETECERADGRIGAARLALAQGNACLASRHLHSSLHFLSAATYALWGKLPESALRTVSRFMTAGQSHVPTQQLLGSFLTAAHLTESQTLTRFSSLPEAAMRERDILLEVRRGAGEQVDTLAVTRDLLYAGTRWALSTGTDCELPDWCGMAKDNVSAEQQLDAVMAVRNALPVHSSKGLCAPMTQALFG